MTPPPPVEQLAARLFQGRAGGDTVYALVDAARQDGLHEEVAGSGLEHASLYEGADEALRPVAPYLVRLEPDAAFTRRLLADGWGESWGIFLTAPLPLAAVRRHLRTFLRVRAGDGRILYFRFYDPRVMRVYLPTCTADELKQVFGPIRRFEMESEDGADLLTFVLAANFDGRLSLGVSRHDLGAVLVEAAEAAVTSNDPLPGPLPAFAGRG